MNSKIKILMLGLTNKAGLAVARAMSKFGCEVDTILLKDVAAKYSKFIHKTYFLGNPSQDVDHFHKKLLIHLRCFKYDALIPLDDGALELCRYRFNEISSLVKIVGLNPYDSYKYSIDKSELLRIGNKCGLSIPRGELIKTLEDYHNKDFSNYSFPLVAKPVSSAKIHNNKLIDFSIQICNNEIELTDFIRENINCIPIIIQEYVEGYGIGYNFISKNGNILNAYIHKRIIEHKGVSTLRESLSADTYGLKDQVTKMVNSMGWSGVGMVEFKINPNSPPVLMEFNGRFFGSTEVSVKSGVNLPELFLKLFILNEDIETNLTVRKATVRFLHDEILLKCEGLLKLKIKSFLIWFLQLSSSFFKKNSFIEDSIFIDPKFSLGMFLFDIKRWFSKLSIKYKTKGVKVNALEKESLSGLKNITFFCHGNICRSPFAKLVAQNLTNDYLFDSLGFVKKEDRMSPTFALSAAKSFKIDLSGHISKSLSSITENNIDLFVIMDKKNYLILKNEGIPDSKIRFLSDEEIHDPYGKSLEEYEKIYKKIKTEIERVFS